jgi:hypothetical protein
VVVLLASYSASLISYLTVRRPNLPFSTFSEFLEDGSFGLGVHRFSSLPSFFEVTHFIGMNEQIQKTNFFVVVELEVLTAVVMKSSIIWDITPCSPLKICLLPVLC